jgi:L-threonylcarbamoyladenylate synthase
MLKPITPTPAAIARAADALRAGDLVAFPTETVYGLGADAANPAAVAAIYRLKGRPADHPVIVHLANPEALAGWADPLPAEARALIAAFWPGPLTLVLPRGPLAHAGLTGGQPTVGLRVPSHPVATSLLERFGGAVAAPSANRFGRISPTRAAHVVSEFSESLDAPMILDGGASPVGLESTIVDLSGAVPRLLRPGSIGPEALAEVLGFEPEPASQAGPRAPGGLASHYAPATPSELLEPALLVVSLGAAPERTGVLSFGTGSYPAASVWRSLPADPSAAGRDLYAALRELDGAGLDRILIETPPDGSGWLAVADRVRRAATPSNSADTATPPPSEEP